MRCWHSQAGMAAWCRRWRRQSFVLYSSRSIDATARWRSRRGRGRSIGAYPEFVSRRAEGACQRTPGRPLVGGRTDSTRHPIAQPAGHIPGRQRGGRVTSHYCRRHQHGHAIGLALVRTSHRLAPEFGRPPRSSKGRTSLFGVLAARIFPTAAHFAGPRRMGHAPNSCRGCASHGLVFPRYHDLHRSFDRQGHADGLQLTGPSHSSTVIDRRC